MAPCASLVVKPGKHGAQVVPPQPLPLHLQGPRVNYWNKYDEPNKLLYFAYNACAEDPRAGPIAKLIEGTLGFVDQHPVERFVIDLRTNEGGDSSLIEPLFTGLAARPALAGKIYAIIGMHTFSSAMLAAMGSSGRCTRRSSADPPRAAPRAMARSRC